MFILQHISFTDYFAFDNIFYILQNVYNMQYILHYKIDNFCTKRRNETITITFADVRARDTHVYRNLDIDKILRF